MLRRADDFIEVRGDLSSASSVAARGGSQQRAGSLDAPGAFKIGTFLRRSAFRTALPTCDGARLVHERARAIRLIRSAATASSTREQCTQMKAAERGRDRMGRRVGLRACCCGGCAAVTARSRRTDPRPRFRRQRRAGGRLSTPLTTRSTNVRANLAPSTPEPSRSSPHRLVAPNPCLPARIWRVSLTGRGQAARSAGPRQGTGPERDRPVLSQKHRYGFSGHRRA